MREPWRREALLRAMLVELARGGYAEMSAARALEAAGVSEDELAAEFASIDACLFAAYDDLTAELVRAVSAACDSAEPWPERVRAGLAALLGELAAEPLLARALVRSFPSIGPTAYERYVDLLARFTPFMREGREYAEVDEELPGEVELLAVGAAEAIIFTEIDTGAAAELPGMMPEILFSILVPFVGPDRATDEMRSAAAAI